MIKLFAGNSDRPEGEGTGADRVHSGPICSRFLILRFQVFLVHLVKEFFHREVVDREQPAEALDGNVCLSLFDAPVLNTRQAKITGEIFMARISLFLPQISELRANAGECII